MLPSSYFITGFVSIACGAWFKVTVDPNRLTDWNPLLRKAHQLVSRPVVAQFGTGRQRKMPSIVT